MREQREIVDKFLSAQNWVWSFNENSF